MNCGVYEVNIGTGSVDQKALWTIYWWKCSFEYLRIFATLCYVHIFNENRMIWDAKGQAVIFLSYNMDGSRVWLKFKDVRSKLR